VASNDNLSSRSDTELVAAYVDDVLRAETIEHVATYNRLFTRRYAIVAELKVRSGGTLQPLRSLLLHADPTVRISAATHFRTIDHAAFEETVRPLAERQDEVGKDARESLSADKLFQEIGYPELEERPPEQGPLPPELQWQCSHSPPDAMSRDAIAQLLHAGLSADRASRLLALARPAIGLWPQRSHSDMPIEASRLGGMPQAPPGWSWPVVGEEPMFFLGQVNCTEIAGLPGGEDLPSCGLLAFFGDHDAVTGCSLPFGDAAVFHWTDLDHFEPASPPVEVQQVLPLCALAFRPLIDLPDPYSRVVQATLTDRDEISRYAALVKTIRHHGIPDDLVFYCGFGKLLGWPSLVQRQDLYSTRPGIFRKAAQLLFQLDQYSNGEESEGWGPGGSLYFMITDQDLRKRRFERCHFEMQCT
jgi:hypothetical protein